MADVARGPQPDHELIERARKRARHEFGRELAEKATPDFLLAMSGSMPRATGDFLLEAMATAAPTPHATIVEFAPETTTPVPVGLGLEAFESALNNLEAAQPAGKFTPRLAYRDAQVRSTRENFFRQCGPVTDHLEKRGAASTRGALESGSHSPAPVTYTCWLNRTVRTAVDPVALAEVCSDPKVTRVDVPRRLQAELTATPVLMGVPAFRDSSGANGEGVIVGVLDQEIALSHPALKDRVIHRRNYTPEPWGTPGPHGIGVAGIIAADGELTGMAPKATIYNYKVLGLRPIYDADDFFGARAIQDALEDGCDVVNCSWGAPGPIDGTSREAVACNTAWALGLVIVKSAGNNGADGPSSITTPADAEGVISVGATSRDGSRVEDFSSRGPTSDGRNRPHLVAPGGSPGDGIISLLIDGTTGSIEYGTSFAAPHVAGIAALLIQQNPNAAPDEIREKLLTACTPLPDEDVNAQGAGLLRLGS